MSLQGLTSLAAIQALFNTGNVQLNRPAVEAGLALLEAGADFANGSIAYEGKWMSGDTFVSLDWKAVALDKTYGYIAQLHTREVILTTDDASVPEIREQRRASF